MPKSITFTIKGAGEPGENAPTVDDVLGQIRDFVGMLEAVEKTVSDDSTNQIVWRITDAERQNPLSFELTPYAVNPAIFVDDRAEEVERVALEGLVALTRGITRPPYFTDDALSKARKIHARVRNGLVGTVVSADGVDNLPPVVIDPDTAWTVERVFEAAKPAEVPYRSLGSVEGFVARAELDGHGRAVLRFKSRLDGTEIKALASGKALRQIESMRLAEVWEGVRVRVYGTIHHKSLSAIDHIDADFVEVLGRTRLPGIDDIVDPNFTGGLSTEEYLAELRNV